MNRRRFLQEVGTGTVVGTGGCLSLPTTSSDAPARTRTPPQSPPGRPTDEQPYPPYTSEPYDADRVIGYETIDPDTAPLYLEPSVGSRTLPGASSSFTLHNRGDRPFMTNDYSWTIHRWEADRWWRVAPKGIPAIGMAELSPGNAKTWQLTVTNDDLSQPAIDFTGRQAISVSGLGGGIYAFGIDGWWKDRDSRRLVAAARFPLDADQLALRPSGAVTGATRDGETVTVTADRELGTEAHPAVFVLERATDTAGAVRSITEQVLRSWPLRDALAYAVPDVDRVRVEAPTMATPAFGIQEGWPPITYEGHTFRVSAHRRDKETTVG